MPEPFRFSSGHLAHTVADLIGVCHQSPQEVISYLKSGDFEKWLAYIGETEISKKVEELRKILFIEEEQLKQFIQVLQPPETSATETIETEQSLETPETSTIEEPETEQSLETPETSAIETTETEQSLETTETSAIETTETEQYLETSETSAIETPETSEVAEESKEAEKIIAPINESSDEVTEAKSFFAKAIQGFKSKYISQG